MKVLDLFSGIGGFSLGLQWAGMQTAAFCEIDPYCRKVLAKHWPTIPIHEDIKELNGEQYSEAVDLVCGGFPCQPFSLAGKRAGSSDDRALWPEMLRVIREVQPTWVIGENVVGIINMELDSCLADLEGEGYACQTFDIPACGVDAHHIRHRIWIVAHAGGDGVRVQPGRGSGENGTKAAWPFDSGEDVANAGCRNGDTRGDVETGELPAKRGIPATNTERRGDLSDADRAGREEQWWTEPVRTEQFAAQCESRWEPEPSVCRVAHGIPNRVDRLKGLGNAVVPQIVEAIGRLILRA